MCGNFPSVADFQIQTVNVWELGGIPILKKAVTVSF